VAPARRARIWNGSRPQGRAGRYGFFEAVDYTGPACPPAMQRPHPVIHGASPGMGLLALDYVLLDRPMQRRFSLVRCCGRRICC